MASSLIVVTIVGAAVIALIAVLLRVRIGRRRIPTARVPSWPENAVAEPPAGPGRDEAPAIATPLATQVRRTGESELQFRLRAAAAAPPDYLPQPSPRPSAPPPSSTTPPPQRGLIAISTVGVPPSLRSTDPNPAAGRGEAPPPASAPTTTRRVGPRPTHRRLVLASGMILVALLGTSVALLNWSTGGVLTATGTPGQVAIGPGESVAGTSAPPAPTAVTGGGGPTTRPHPGGGSGTGGGPNPRPNGPGATPRPERTSTPTEHPTPRPTPRPTPTPAPTPTPTPAGKAPDVDFDVSVNGLDARFKNHTKGAASWTWDFGDGSTSTARNPSHAYAHAGTYHVVLRAVGESGGTDSLTKTVVVAP